MWTLTSYSHPQVPCHQANQPASPEDPVGNEEGGPNHIRTQKPRDFSRYIRRFQHPSSLSTYFLFVDTVKDWHKISLDDTLYSTMEIEPD